MKKTACVLVTLKVMQRGVTITPAMSSKAPLSSTHGSTDGLRMGEEELMGGGDGGFGVVGY